MNNSTMKMYSNGYRMISIAQMKDTDHNWKQKQNKSNMKRNYWDVQLRNRDSILWHLVQNVTPHGENEMDRGLRG